MKSALYFLMTWVTKL